jgi:hypothetical protein
MEVVPAGELAWSEYYLGLAAVSLALAAGAWLGVFPLTLLPDAALAGVVAVAFAVSAAVQSYRSRATRLGSPGPPPSARPGVGPAPADADPPDDDRAT